MIRIEWQSPSGVSGHDDSKRAEFMSSIASLNDMSNPDWSGTSHWLGESSAIAGEEHGG